MTRALLLAALLLSGCAAESAEPVGYASDDQTLSPEVACVADRPVCVEAHYCDDDTRAEGWQVCYDQPDGVCVVGFVPAGEECFDGTIGRCDGKGNCR